MTGKEFFFEGGYEYETYSHSGSYCMYHRCVVKLVALCFQKKMVALVWGGALLYVKGKKKKWQGEWRRKHS